MTHPVGWVIQCTGIVKALRRVIVMVDLWSQVVYVYWAAVGCKFLGSIFVPDVYALPRSARFVLLFSNRPSFFYPIAKRKSRDLNCSPLALLWVYWQINPQDHGTSKATRSFSHGESKFIFSSPVMIFPMSNTWDEKSVDQVLFSCKQIESRCQDSLVSKNLSKTFFSFLLNSSPTFEIDIIIKHSLDYTKCLNVV